MRDPYEENYKTLMNRMKELNKWRHTPCSWIGRLMSSQFDLIFNEIPIKTQASYYVDIDKLFLNSEIKHPEKPT